MTLLEPLIANNENHSMMIHLNVMETLGVVLMA